MFPLTKGDIGRGCQQWMVVGLGDWGRLRADRRGQSGQNGHHDDCGFHWTVP